MATTVDRRSTAHRLLAAGALLFAAAVILAGTTACAARGGDTTATGAGASTSSASTSSGGAWVEGHDCAPSFTRLTAASPSRAGELVPTGATAAQLCVYTSAAAEPDLLDGVRPVTGPAALLVATLNALPAGPTGVGASEACPRAGLSYQIVLTYGDRSLLVGLTPYCGAGQDGAVRRLGLAELVAVMGHFGEFRPAGIDADRPFDPQSSSNLPAVLDVTMRHQAALAPAAEVIQRAGQADPASGLLCVSFADVKAGGGIVVRLHGTPSAALSAAIDQARELAEGIASVTSVQVPADGCGGSEPETVVFV